MMLDPHACYQALKSRDERFDGRFFTGVLTTGVYCRPVCPAPTPKRENVRFFACAAAAEEAGFRPCLRCRPESSPGTPVWQGTATSVSRALRLIEAGALDEGSVADLAGQLGMGARHLRRLFKKHLGAAPVTVAQTRRVQFAKKLIDETPLPVTEIAFSAGFASIRRFNAAFQQVYGRAPSALRRKNKATASGPGGYLQLKLYYRPPFDGAALFRFLKARALPGVEAVDDGAYRRTVRVGKTAGIITLQRVEEKRHVLLQVPPELIKGLLPLVDRARRLLDLKADLNVITGHLASDPLLAAATARHPGLRVPGAWDGFETAIRTVLGQQVSVGAANVLAGRLIEAYGEPFSDVGDGDLKYLFPTPQALTQIEPTRVGLPRKRAEAIRNLAQAVLEGILPLSTGAGLDEVLERLTALPGIGPWTANYIAMRALGEPDAFPAGDAVLRRAAAGPSETPLTEAQLLERAERWRPWRAYAAVYLWQQMT